MKKKSTKTPKRTTKQKSKSVAGSKPNVRISLTGDAAAQLAYALQTDPSPLTVSVPGDNPVLGTLTFVMTNQQEDPVVVTSIGFTINVGDDGSALTASLGGTKTAVSDDVKWQVTGPPKEGQTDNTATYKLGPQTGSSVTMQPGDSVWLQIYDIAMNNAVGVTTIGIKEMTQGNAPAFPEFDVTKFPYGFYFDGLVATVQSGSAFVPVAEVGYNNPVTLLWNSSVTDVSAFQVFYATNQGQQSLPGVTTPGRWDSPQLTRDAVFTVVVNSTTVGGEPVSASLSIMVAVQQPDVVATSLNVAGPSTLQGNVAVGTAGVPAALAVSGAATAGSVSAGSLAITGASTLGSAAISGAATAGSLQTPSLNASAATLGAATVSNLNALGGPVAMINGTTALTPGSPQSPAGFQALTDGFVVCYIGSVPSYPTGGCICWGSAYANGITLQCTGGNVGYFGPGWEDCMANNPNSFVLPVPANSYYYVWVQQGNSGCQQVNAPYNFYWVPMGANPGAATIKALKKPDPSFRPPGPMKLESQHSTSGRAEFIAILERLLDKPIDKVTKRQLLKALGGA